MRLFPIILGQRYPLLKSQLEGTPNFAEICEKNDFVGLLNEIRGFCGKNDQNNNEVYAVMNSLRALIVIFKS